MKKSLWVKPLLVGYNCLGYSRYYCGYGLNCDISTAEIIQERTVTSAL